MKLFEIVSALVLRVKSEDVFGSPMSWKQIGEIFSLSDDAVRHRVTSFKKKYNVVDSDLDNIEWNREFIQKNAPESEMKELEKAVYWPGDVVHVHDSEHIVLSFHEDSDEFDGIYGYEGDYDTCWFDEVQVDESQTLVEKRQIDNIDHSDEDEPAIVGADIKYTAPPKFLITPNVLIVVRDEQPLSIDRSHKNFDKIKSALDAQEWQKMFDYIDMKSALSKYSKGRVKIEDGKVTLDDEEVHSRLTDRLVNLLLEENIQQLDALINFMEKVDSNPDFKVVSRIYDFMKANDIRIHEDGDIMCYKRVRNNYLDVYSGTMDNSPGKTVTMKRNMVNSNDNETCSHGLHVCSISYLKSFSGDRVVLCKVNPRDIVSIPTDYNNAKMRCCGYEVVKDCTENFSDDISGLTV